MKTSLFFPLVGLAVAIASSALGQDQANLSTARQIAMQGLVDYDAGRYEEARDKLARAYAVVGLPTLGRDCARALVKLGRYVEAAELYLEVTRLEVKGGDKVGQEQAKADAATERAALVPRIPRLLITLEGARPEESTVDVDGVQVPSALLGIERLVNPGDHRIKAVSNGQTAEETVQVTEGATRKVVLTFRSSPSAEGPAPVVVGAPPKNSGNAQALSASEAEKDHGKSSPLPRTLGWVGLGAGGVGLVVGSITGLMAISRRSDLDDNGCSDSHCYADQSDDVDGYNSLRTISTIGFVGGGLLAATGGVLLLVSPSKSSSGSRGIKPWVGFGSAGMSGRF